MTHSLTIVIGARSSCLAMANPCNRGTSLSPVGGRDAAPRHSSLTHARGNCGGRATYVNMGMRLLSFPAATRRRSRS